MWKECFIIIDLNLQVDELSKLLKRQLCWLSQKHPNIGVNWRTVAIPGGTSFEAESSETQHL